jgi:pimeloyl-ACP methyl ester carboxylesterase
MTEPQYLMVRVIDHAGYYETRCLLAVLALAFVAFAWKRGDTRFAIAFVFGALFQMVLEWILQSSGLRGAYSLTVFGMTASGPVATLFQGIVEGGPLSLMGYWFVRVAMNDTRSLGGRNAYIAGCVIVVVLAAIAASLAFGSQVSSARPIRFLDPLLIGTIVISVVLASLRGWAGLRMLGLFFLGLLIYSVATFEVLHLAGVRYIGVGTADNFTTASMPAQILVMSASIAVEVAAAKLHYFAVPLALGLFADRGKTKGPTFVFLHGWLMSPAIWTAAERVLPRNANILTLWQPSHGSEPGLPEAATMQDWIARLFARIDAEGDSPVVLVGHSMGGLLAIQAALDRPDRIAGLVLTGAASRAWSEETIAGWRAMAGAAMHGWSNETAKLLAPFLLGPKFVNDADFINRWAEEVAAYRLAEMGGLVDAIATRPATDTRLGSLTVPALIVHGAADNSIPLQEAEFIAKAISDAQLVVLPDVGHCPPLEAPELFSKHFSAFLKRNGWA